MLFVNQSEKLQYQPWHIDPFGLTAFIGISLRDNGAKLQNGPAYFHHRRL
jgi:hypothetical protein